MPLEKMPAFFEGTAPTKNTAADYLTSKAPKITVPRQPQTVSMTCEANYLLVKCDSSSFHRRGSISNMSMPAARTAVSGKTILRGCMHQPVPSV